MEKGIDIPSVQSVSGRLIAWAQTRQTNGFLEAINGLFQAAKRKARGYGRFHTMRVVIFLVAGNLKFSAINPHAA